MNAELVISGGPIWTGLRSGFAGAVAIAGGKVVAVGGRGDVAAWTGPSTRRIELDGRLALPAFNDPHLHLATLGRSLSEIDLRGAGVDDLLARVATAAGNGSGWLIGRGYDDVAWAGRVPTLAELDAASAGRPLFLRRVCGHQFLANSVALAQAGIDADRADPAGGRILRDASGAPTGQLLEDAGQLVVAAMPAATVADYADQTRCAQSLLASQGIASVMDAAVGRATYDELLALESLADAGALPLRTWVCLYGGHGGVVERAHADGFRFGRQNGTLRYGAAKLFADGAVGARTAAMSVPYPAGGHGDLAYCDDEMAERLRRFDELGYQLAIHAIGDAAIGQVLAVMETLPQTRQRRHRIEHGGFATPGQRRRMRAAGVSLVPQPVFISAMGDSYAHVLGRERAAASYPMRTWLDEGFALSASSDAPVCTSDPLASLAAMMTRRTASGDVFDASEQLDLATALDLQTRGGAWTQFAEKDVGTLEPGMQADVAVLSHDLFALPVEAFARVRCDMTLIGGRTIFER